MGRVLLKRPPTPSYAWTQKTGAASWLARDGAGLLYLNDRLWIFGGWDGGSTSTPGQIGQSLFPGKPTTNQILSSVDEGATWVEDLAHVENPPTSGPGARWRRRHSPGCFVHRDGGVDYAYVVGGDHLDNVVADFQDANSRGYPADVWRSADPGNANGWVRIAESSSVGWAGRMLAIHGSHEGDLYTIGGQDGLFGAHPPPYANALTPTLYDDVWKSSNQGASFTRILEHAPFGPVGIVQKLLSWRGRIWVITGGTYPTGTAEGGPAYIASNPRTWSNQVWSSKAGVTWHRHADAPCTPRHYTSVEVWDDRMWIVAGYEDSINTNNYLSTGDGDNWVSHGNAPFDEGHADGLCATPFGLVHATGNGTLHTGVRDVHVLQRAA